MKFKLMAAAAALVMSAGAASAVIAPTATCTGSGTTGNNGGQTITATYDLYLSSGSASCVFTGVGNNDGNDQSNTAFQTYLANNGLSLLTKVTSTGSLDTGNPSYTSLLADFVDGTFSNADFSGLTNPLLVFKSGPTFGAFSLATTGPVSGSWTYSGQGSLSHVSLYASTAPVPLPAAGLMLAGALGGLGALRRRRKNRAA